MSTKAEIEAGFNFPKTGIKTEEKLEKSIYSYVDSQGRGVIRRMTRALLVAGISDLSRFENEETTKTLLSVAQKAVEGSVTMQEAHKKALLELKRMMGGQETTVASFAGMVASLRVINYGVEAFFDQRKDSPQNGLNNY